MGGMTHHENARSDDVSLEDLLSICAGGRCFSAVVSYNLFINQVRAAITGIAFGMVSLRFWSLECAQMCPDRRGWRRQVL
jgi:hypothetical protein